MTEINTLKQTKNVDSSELSSDISDEYLDLCVQNDNIGYSPNTKEIFITELNPEEKIRIKHSRFYSENLESNTASQKRRKLDMGELNLKKINVNLKSIAEDELENLNTKKFTF